METKIEEPVIKIYVDTLLKLENGNLFVVNNIRDVDGKYIVELVKTTAEDQIDMDYLNELASENYEPEPDDSFMDRD